MSSIQQLLGLRALRRPGVGATPLRTAPERVRSFNDRDTQKEAPEVAAERRRTAAASTLDACAAAATTRSSSARYSRKHARPRAVIRQIVLVRRPLVSLRIST